MQLTSHIIVSKDATNNRYQRKSLENLIHQVYAKQYGADVQHFMPYLLGIHDEKGQFHAGLGFRHADSGDLYLENYLDKPVEQRLTDVLHAPAPEIKRTNIVEVGNLAADTAGYTRWLIITLCGYLQGAGYDWVVFTAVPSLRNSFRKLGLKLFPLGMAVKERLPASEQAQWGNYYDCNPEVCAVNVHHTYGVLERLLRLEASLGKIRNLWQESYSIGHQALVANSVVAGRHE